MGFAETKIKVNDLKGLQPFYDRQESLLRSEQSVDWRRNREKMIEILLLLSSILSAAIILFILYFVVKTAMPAILKNGIGFLVNGGFDQQLQKLWLNPESNVRFGALPLIMGTVLTTVGALILTLFLGLGCSIFLAELAPNSFKKPIESVVRLLAGIPSVVFGLIGLLVVVPWINNTFVPTELALKYIKITPLDGTSLLAGVIVLTFMILPFFITVTTDAINALPDHYRNGSLALGLTHWRTIIRLLLPAAMPGIIAGLMLAAARGIGEAIALSMVTGSVSLIPNPSHGMVFFIEPLRTMAATIIDNGEAFPVEIIESTMFALGAFILLFSISLSLLARLFTKWFNKRVMAL